MQSRRNPIFISNSLSLKRTWRYCLKISHLLYLLALFHTGLPSAALALASPTPPPSSKNSNVIDSSKQNMSPIKTVMVTGANGYLASHIVKILLEKGYNVRACVRNAANESSVGHLRNLVKDSTASMGTLSLFSIGDMGDPSLAGRYDEPLGGCQAVFHAATPLSPKISGREFDGERDILRPGMEGTQELLDSILRSEDTKKSLQCLVLTSSMSAAAPNPAPAVKDESHWSDDKAQLSNGNFYGCLKTRQERLVQEWTIAQKNCGNISQQFRFAAICPTMILGPPVLSPAANPYTPSGTMGRLHQWLTEGMPQAPNDSMSFIHVKDCAAMHVAAMENPNASGRYMSLVESWHWNDIFMTFKELYPNLPPVKPYEGAEKAKPTQFNLDRMNSLGVKVSSMNSILKDSVEFMKSSGVL